MKPAGQQTVVRHRYVRTRKGATSRLRDALRYMQQRPLGRDEQAHDRQLFTAHTDGLSRQQARAVLLAHAGQRVAYHRLILSPGRPLEDLQCWTRLVLADLARHLGQELHWVAVVHRNTLHPHVHLLLAGMGERLPGRDGRPTPLRLRPDAYAVLRASGDRHARELARDERSLREAVRSELDLLSGLGRALAVEFADEGIQTHRHLIEEHERRGAPGRDATRGR